jgi:hypothetical protein
MLGCLAACAEQANRKQKVMMNFFILISWIFLSPVTSQLAHEESDVD